MLSRHFLFCKAGGVAASAAKLFRGIAGAEAVKNGSGAVGIQNVRQFLVQKVAKGNITLVIKAAGNDCTVTQNADVVAHTIAENTLAVYICLQIRPLKLVRVFQIDLLPDANTPGFGYPRLGEVAVQHFNDFFVFRISAALIPKPVGYDHLALRLHTKTETAVQIVSKGNGQIVGFIGMEGDVDLVKSHRSAKTFCVSGEGDTVCGQNDPEARLLRKL